MRTSFSGYILMLGGFLSLALGSCEKTNGIDNNNVIVKPYTLLVSDTTGLLLYSNDGSEYMQKEAKTNDGIPMRAMATAGNNIIIIKNNAFVSDNEGTTFNPISPAGGLQASAFGFNQAMVVNLKKEWKRIYMAGFDNRGLIYSDSNGARGSWRSDLAFDQSVAMTFTVTSFTQLKNGTLFALDAFNNRLFMRPNINTKWTEVTMSGIAGAPGMYLSHFGDNLIMADVAGSGVWYSSNNGANWTKYAGLPANTRYNVVYAPFELTLLVGTNRGVYRYDPSTTQFLPSNNGLTTNTEVRGITAKDRVYKNQEENQGINALFIFMATRTGVYRSQDLGQNWFLVREGNYTAIY